MTTSKPETDSYSWLEHFPVSMFAIVMGLCGLTLALTALEHAYTLGAVASTLSYSVTCVVFAAIAAVYVMKASQFPERIIEEWRHPIRIAFFPAISISLILLGTTTMQRNPPLAEFLWLVGMVGQGILTIAVTSVWISAKSLTIGHLNPAWFIPAVGNVLVPIAGVPLGYIEISWYFMAVGLFYWVILLTLVFNRLIFHDPLPGRLQPTLVILIAPPAVAFVAWLRLIGGVDHFAHLLLNGVYLFSLIVLVQVPKILRLPFAMSFWALSFPVAAGSVASFLYAQETGSGTHQLIGLGYLCVLGLIIAGLVLRTVRALIRNEIFHPE